MKESDRLATLEQELTRLGIRTDVRPDGLTVHGGTPRPAAFDSHGDHRIAMAMAVAANAVEGESTVRGFAAVESSYPEFASILAKVTGEGIG